MDGILGLRRTASRATRLLTAALVLGVLWGCDGGGKSLGGHATGSLEALSVPDAPVEAPTETFLAPDGTATDLSAFRGRVVVLNVWAMWCRPCRTELPTIAALDSAYGDEIAVVAVNVDRTPQEVETARAFLSEHAPLAFYSDPTFELPFRLPGRGAMPQTILIDRDGRIRAWLAGEADWNSPEARALIDTLVAEDA
ncbi:MAG: TlpA family protein disulfide reductase [Caulobacterales bacterium]|nr:TlpA family protein disulfide reductase [Caulobacterales bacterium]